MEYWIIVDGKAQGPYGIDEMIRRGVTPSTPVWRQGMTEWVPAATVRELAEYFSVNESYLSQQLGYSTPPPSPSAVPAQQPGYGNQPNPLYAEERPAMPSTYLGWNIAATVLCCIPCGIIGIIFSAMVRNKYDYGDYAGAQNASKWASIWLILSVVLGIIQIVFAFVINIFSFL